MPSNTDRVSALASRLPVDFTRGFATSSWQIEGSSQTRGRSIWDDFSETPGKVLDGATADPACDHLNHISDDLDLIRDLGANAYRFSFSWPRIIPGGIGGVSYEGLDVYDRIVDGVLERGLTPYATLYHWDLPSTLQERGGWLNQDSGQWFIEYAGVVADRFSDRIKTVATLNEPWVSAFLGYSAGIHAPGIQDGAMSLEVMYRLMVASGAGIKVLKSAGIANPGLVLNLTEIIAEDEAVKPQASIIDGLQNRIFLDLLAGRGLPDDVVAATSSLTDWSFVTDAGLAAAAEPVSWLGINYYTPTRVASTGETSGKTVGQDSSVYPGVTDVAFVPREPRTAMGWEVRPQSLTETLIQTSRRLPGVPLYVTENGAAFDDVVAGDGIHDDARVRYFDAHLHAALDALDHGVDLRGYFAWSLFDNLEWAEGWTKRFGVVRVDADTQKRTPKDSALFLRDVYRWGN